jgi:2,3-bisphosphoglycerate-dependent phosphoglycerate mutase
VQTGYEVAEALDLPLLGWVDIHETGGMFLFDKETETFLPEPGRTRGYLEQHYPRLVLSDEVTEEGWWNRPFEPKEHRAPRARRVLSRLLSSHAISSDDGVAIVSHGGFYNYLMRAILGLPERDPELEYDPVWFAANNTSITHVEFREEQAVVRCLNRVDFLPADLLT